MKDSIEAFYSRLTALAKLVNYELDADVLDLYARVLESVGWARLCDGVDRIALDLGPGKPFPSIRALREAATGERSPGPGAGMLEDVDQARAAASLIIGAISRYGATNSAAGIERVRASVGELGWAIIQMRGGWNFVCETTTNDNISFLERDLRELARGKLERIRLGCDGPPGLPEGPRGPGGRLDSADLLSALPEDARRRLAERQAKAKRDEEDEKK